MDETQNLMIWLFNKIFEDESIQTELQKLLVSVISTDYVSSSV